MNESDLNRIVVLPNIGRITVKDAIDKGLLESPHYSNYGGTNSLSGKTYEEIYGRERAKEFRETLTGGKLPTEVREKISKSMIGKNTGKKTPEHCLSISQTLTGQKCPWLEGDRNPMRRPEVRDERSKALIEKWKNSEFAKMMIKATMDSKSYNGYESKEHAELKTEAQLALERKGFRVENEFRILKPNLNGFYIVDVVGINGNVRVAVECGDCDEEKLKDLTNLFDMVFYKPYEGKTRLIPTG